MKYRIEFKKSAAKVLKKLPKQDRRRIRDKIDNFAKKLLDPVRDRIRLKHYSIRTEQSYVSWIKRFILFHNKKHPKDMGVADIEQFLTHLAVKRNVAPSTQNQALNAIIFLYREVLDIELKEPINAIRAKKPLRLPVVLTKAEVSKLINTLSGTQKIIGMLLYGAGLRLMECIRLRVKDIDFNMDQIVVRGGKGDKDRITLLPQSVKGDLQKHLDRIQLLHNDDLAQGYGKVFMPRALERKFKHANQQWIWQYVFPSKSISKDRRKLVHKGSYQKNSKAHDNIRLSKSRVCFAIRTTVPVPVLLQRSLMHSNSARFSQTIIHSAPFKDLNEKLPDPSSSQFVKSLIGKLR